MLASLERFYDLVSDGGVVVLDDFGFWEGARVAFFEFFARRGEAPLVERAGLDQLWFVKGRRHNRPRHWGDCTAAGEGGWAACETRAVKVR